MGNTLRNALGALGALATAVAALAVWAPRAVAETEPLATVVAAVAGVSPRTLFVLGSAAIVVSVALSVFGSRDARLVAGDPSASERFDRVVTDGPETVRAADGTLVAAEFDGAVRRATDGDERALTEVRERLRALAVARLARLEDVSSPESAGTETEDTAPDADTRVAERAVETGSWTDERTPAAFLSGAEGPTPSLGSRLRLWLDPAAERDRRIRRTVGALRDIGSHPSDGDSAGSETTVADGGVDR